MSEAARNGNGAGGDLPKVCVIGAGSSGIAAIKALRDRGIAFDCFEKSDRVGGNWVFGNKNGMSAAYRDLFINVSRERMQYADYPMPDSIPDFPHHTHIARYFTVERMTADTIALYRELLGATAADGRL